MNSAVVTFLGSSTVTLYSILQNKIYLKIFRLKEEIKEKESHTKGLNLAPY